jgi:hypothetical protein
MSDGITWGELQDDTKYNIAVLLNQGKLSVGSGDKIEKLVLENLKQTGYTFQGDGGKITLYEDIKFYIAPDDPVNVEGGRQRKTLRRRRRRNTLRRRRGRRMTTRASR